MTVYKRMPLYRLCALNVGTPPEEGVVLPKAEDRVVAAELIAEDSAYEWGLDQPAWTIGNEYVLDEATLTTMLDSLRSAKDMHNAWAIRRREDAAARQRALKPPELHGE